ncbi:P2Y purinoceptor 14-like [Syngnathoides biaculeatus]|uniref:P2Y purinoceptor 14-like n=1 Tax=Syngnathoides biaculeatus TaxID=300417 RepID=UPI002ADE0E9B|nr:P2Y purinoceptor 14-like [Syngnathoides biaculeatus]
MPVDADGPLNYSSNESVWMSPSCGRPPVTWTRHVFTVVYGLLFLTGLLLNGVTLKMFLRGARSSRCVTVYLKNLAAADFLLSLCLPFRIAKHAGAWRPLLRAYCSFGAPAFYLNMYASILFMGYVAANRYLKIVRPSRTPVLQSAAAAHAVSAATWLVLLTLTGAYIVVSLVALPADDGDAATCEDLQSQLLKSFYKVVHGFSAAVFLLVLAALLFFYCGTSRRLAAAQRRRAGSSGARKLAKSRRKIRVLVSVFCVCFVPYHLVRLPYAVLKPSGCSARTAFFYLKDVTVAVSVFNICLDPLIYFLFCDAFRHRPKRSRAAATPEARPFGGGLRSRKMSDCPSSICLT